MKPGDAVKSEEIVVEVMTEKVNVEITAPVSGTVKSLGKSEGEVINVGEVLITFDETSSPSKPAQTVKKESSEKDDSLFTPSQPFVVSGTLGKKKEASKSIINERPLAAPAVRKKARELEVGFHTVICKYIQVEKPLKSPQKHSYQPALKTILLVGLNEYL